MLSHVEASKYARPHVRPVVDRRTSHAVAASMLQADNAEGPAAFSYNTYILTNSLSTVLYVGVTNNLEARLLQHREKATPGFTSRYNINKLVYYEAYDRATDAIAREKQLRGWRRKKKVSLLESTNKGWKGLSADWYR